MEKTGYPVDSRYYVLKQDESLGPFDVEELLEQIEIGAFSYEDICLREGDTECQRLKEVLDWEDAPVTTRSEDLNEPAAHGLDETETETTANPSQEKAKMEPGTILYRGHPSILSQPLPLLGLLGGITGGIWLYPIDEQLALIPTSIALLSLFAVSLKRFTNDYVVTGRRIEIVKGLIARSSNEVRIADVRAINVTCRGFIGAIGIGTVDFFTAGDAPEVTFERVWAAKKVKALVRKLQDSPI